jgi:hypothetical protein
MLLHTQVPDILLAPKFHCYMYALQVKNVWDSSCCRSNFKICYSKSSPTTHHVGAWEDRMYSSYSFLTSAVDGDEWSASCPGCALPPRERTLITHCIEGWVGPRAGLDTEARGKILLSLPGIEPQLPSRPVRRHTLYSNPSSNIQPTP